MKEVDEFISNFYSSDDISEVFSNEQGYWFAIILHRRFIRSGAFIVCDRWKKHFGTNISGKVYDITGDVTDKYEWIPWNTIRSK